MAEQQEKMTIEDLAKSIENLAGMTQRGFTEQAKRSDDLENGQKRLEDRQEKLEHRFEITEFSIKDIRTEIANLTILIRKSSNEEEIAQLKHRVTLLEAQLAR